jgi:CBS domain-containing protein
MFRAGLAIGIMADALENGRERLHPILVTQVLRADGSRKRELRVFCEARGSSVPIDVCRACTRCHGITGERDPRGWVCCTPPDVPEHDEELGPSAGVALREGAVAVEEGVLVRDVVALFAERRLRVVVVVDGDGHAAGLVQESQLLPEIRAHTRTDGGGDRIGWGLVAAEQASSVMSSVRPIPEGISVREALAEMAGLHHQRLVVVDGEGVPVGVLVDVHALMALHGNRGEH